MLHVCSHTLVLIFILKFLIIYLLLSIIIICLHINDFFLSSFLIFILFHPSISFFAILVFFPSYFTFSWVEVISFLLHWHFPFYLVFPPPPFPPCHHPLLLFLLILFIIIILFLSLSEPTNIFFLYSIIFIPLKLMKLC